MKVHSQVAVVCRRAVVKVVLRLTTHCQYEWKWLCVKGSRPHASMSQQCNAFCRLLRSSSLLSHTLVESFAPCLIVCLLHIFPLHRSDTVVMSGPAHLYQPVPTTSTPLPASVSRPLVDSPYEDEDDERLKRRNINPHDHPPTDINPRTSHSPNQLPPAGLLATSLLTLLVGLWLLLWGAGLLGGGGVWWVWRAVAVGCGGFLSVSGVYSAWEWWEERSGGSHARRASSGYTFPEFRK